MAEFFPYEVPRGGGGLSRSQQARLLRAAQQGTGALDPTIPDAGIGELGALGAVYLAEELEWMFAEILDDGRFEEASGSGPSFGHAYAWEMRIPGPAGTWMAPRNPLKGTNGHDTGGEKYMPAYEANGNLFVPPGTVVQLWRGYSNATGSGSPAEGQEWVFWQGESVGAGSNGPIWTVPVDNCDENGNIVRTVYTITLPVGTTVELTTEG